MGFDYNRMLHKYEYMPIAVDMGLMYRANFRVMVSWGINVPRGVRERTDRTSICRR